MIRVAYWYGNRSKDAGSLETYSGYDNAHILPSGAVSFTDKEGAMIFAVAPGDWHDIVFTIEDEED